MLSADLGPARGAPAQLAPPLSGSPLAPPCRHTEAQCCLCLAVTETYKDGASRGSQATSATVCASGSDRIARGQYCLSAASPMPCSTLTACTAVCIPEEHALQPWLAQAQAACASCAGWRAPPLPAHRLPWLAAPLPAACSLMLSAYVRSRGLQAPASGAGHGYLLSAHEKAA